MQDDPFDDYYSDKPKRAGLRNQRRSIQIIEALIVVVLVVAAVRLFTNGNSDDSQLDVADLMELGAQAAINGDTDAAIQNYTLALELEPTNGEAYFARGEIYYDIDEYDKAIVDFTDAIVHDFDTPAEALYLRARSRDKLDSAQAAIDDYTRVIELDSTHADAYYYRGTQYRDEGENHHAISDLTNAIEYGYEPVAYAYFFQGAAYDDVEDYENAVASYTLAIEHTSDCEEFLCWIDYNNRGVAYYRMDDYATAIEDYTTAIAVSDEPYALAYVNRADAYNAISQTDQALADWDMALNIYEQVTTNRTFNEQATADGTQVVGDTIHDAGVQIHVTFTGIEGQSITLYTERPEESFIDTVLMLRAPDGTPLAFNDDDGDSLTSRIEDFELPRSGVYTIIVAGEGGDSTGKFLLKMK